ncbi:MAG: cation:proton antiporter [Phycisphaerae bacterium]|nr:cation:proton antiporter [Phycisphaerae bacterium]
MVIWTALLDVLVLLLAALVLGALCERLRQNAVIGYLLAGTLLGPRALNLMPNHEAVKTIAELGVALLLFTIGLEFSWRRLRGLGVIALGGGTLQVLAMGGLGASVSIALGLEWRPAVVVGAVIALSSTACVLRLLVSRGEIDSIYGRNALGILLLQDIAVVPLVILVSVLEHGGSFVQVGLEIGRAVGVAVLVAGTLYVLLTYVAPAVLGTEAAAQNRELPILLAIVTAIGAGWATHWLGLSPVLGAFVAGIMLAESPFATQIRGDVAPLRTVFVTLFFSSIGMLADPAWVLSNWSVVILVVLAIVVGKAAVVSGVAFLFRLRLGHAAAAGICLAQVGEFSFVLADEAHSGEVIDSSLFKLIVSATIATLFLTPYLVAVAPLVARYLGRLSRGGRPGAEQLDVTEQRDAQIPRGHVLIVGFGPAGRSVAESLIGRHKHLLAVIELSRKSAEIARSYGLRTEIGDATRPEILEHMGIQTAAAVVVTAPDPTTTRHIIEQSRSLAPATPIIARARFHVYRWELILAGADAVIDEEEQVGLRLAAAVRRRLRLAEQGAGGASTQT